MQRKRFLFVTPPGYGHLFPMVPLAWALHAAGHHVLVGSCGVSVSAATRAGLSTVNLAPNANLKELFHRFRDGYRQAFYDPDEPADGRGSSETAGETLFTVLGDLMLDGLQRLMKTWCPHLMVYTPYAAAAPIAAAGCGVPTVFLSIAPAYTPKAMFAGTYSRMVATCQRGGIVEPAQPTRWIDICPPSLRTAPSDGILMQPVSYTGGELLDTLPIDGGRPRIVVTLGTVVPLAEGLAPIAWLIEAARLLRAEFVIAHGLPDARALGALPPNVRASSWIGLTHLLAGSAAVIHHGGPGTMFAALDAGLPQFVIPRGSDQFYNARVLRRRGVALVDGEHPLEATTIERLLSAQHLRRAAEDVGQEIRGMPAPSEIAGQLATMVA